MAALIGKAAKLDSIGRAKIAAGKALVSQGTKGLDEMVTFVQESLYLMSVIGNRSVAEIIGDLADFDGSELRPSGATSHTPTAKLEAVRRQLTVGPVTFYKVPAPAPAPVA